MSVRSEISRAIADARDRAASSGALAIAQETELPPINLERPANPDHGDWASNVAMQLAPVARSAPIRIAETLLEHFERPVSVAEVSVAAPGFLNFRLDPTWVAGQVGPIRDAGAAYGRGTAAQPQRINVEFVSANPTGPLHVGNARGAFVGDVLSRVLDAAGHDVTREYYFNDFGGQVKALGASVRAIRQGSPLPEDGYRGDYVGEMAASVPDAGRARRRGCRARRGRLDLRSVGVRGAAGRDRGQPRRPWSPLRRVEDGELRPRRRVGDARRRAPSRSRIRLRRGRRDLVPLDGLRRRSGSRDLSVQRPADLLRRGHRLRQREVQPRLRRADLRLGREPPRRRRPTHPCGHRTRP